MIRYASYGFVVFTLAATIPIAAAETVTYKYDAKGRLVQVSHSGSVNAGTTTIYTHDKADNRSNVKVTNAPS